MFSYVLPSIVKMEITWKIKKAEVLRENKTKKREQLINSICL